MTWGNYISAWARTSATEFSGTKRVLDPSIGNTTSYGDGYLTFPLSATMVSDWISSSATNYGVGLELVDDTLLGISSPTVALSSTTTQKNAFLIVVTSGASQNKPSSIVWEGSVSTSWNNDANWVGGLKPDSTQYALFDFNVSNVNCILDLDTSIRGVSANSYSGTLDLGTARTLGVNRS